MNLIKIKSIKKIGKEDRYDLKIGATNNFFANNILIHNSSGIVSNVLVKKNVNILTKALNKLGAGIPTEKYAYIYSSGKPKSRLPKGIVGAYKNDGPDYYSTDIWKQTYEKLKDFVPHGMTLYYEIVGFAEGGQAIQKGLGKAFDYGCEPNRLETYIYRITYTNDQGNVFEFSAKQVQEWCTQHGLNPVIELYYGYAMDLAKQINRKHKLVKSLRADKNFGDNFLELVKLEYNEKECFVCKNVLPEEGCVVRVEGSGFEAYKQKSKTFYDMETKQLDKGEVGMEE